MSRFRTLRALHERRRGVLLQDRVRERYPRVRCNTMLKKTASLFGILSLSVWVPLSSPTSFRVATFLLRIRHLSPPGLRPTRPCTGEPSACPWTTRRSATAPSAPPCPTCASMKAPASSRYVLITSFAVVPR